MIKTRQKKATKAGKREVFGKVVMVKAKPQEEEDDEEEEDEEEPAEPKPPKPPPKPPAAEFGTAVVIGAEAVRLLNELPEVTPAVTFASGAGEGLLRMLRGEPLPGLQACVP